MATFGYTTMGASLIAVAGNYLSWYDMGYTPEQSGVLVSATVGGRSGSISDVPVEMGVFRKTGVRSGQFVANTETIATKRNPMYAFYTATILGDAEVSNTEEYLITINKPTPGVEVAFDVASEGTGSAYFGWTFGSWPSSFTGGTLWTSNHKYSIYATYEPAAAPPAVTTHAVTNLTVMS